MTVVSKRTASFPASLRDLAVLAIMLGIAAILTAAMVLQFAEGEIPCPLCLLQRVALFGTCFGLVCHVAHGYSARNIGMSLLWAVFLLIVSVRQVLLDIVRRPGHGYVGSAVFGLHMPVWSVLIATALLAAFAIVLIVFEDEHLPARSSPTILTKIAAWAGYYVVALCLMNLISAVLQCGFGACHTSGYKLL